MVARRGEQLGAATASVTDPQWGISAVILTGMSIAMELI